MNRVSPHVKLVDDAVFQGQIERAIAFPVKVICNNAARPLTHPLAPDFPAFQGPGIRVKENMLSVEPVSFTCGLIGPVRFVPISEGWV